MKEGWEYKKLGEICRVINGRAYSKDEMLSQGKYRLLRVGNFFTNDSWYYSDLELEEDKYCDNGDLLYAWSASFGPRIWDGEKVIYHYHIWKMVCSPEIDKYFLCYWLDSDELKKQTMTNLHGATMAHITKRIIENAIVSYPSLSEQKSIVDYLDSAFAKVDAMKANAEKALNEAKALFQASLKEMLEPKEGWEEKKFGEVCWYSKNNGLHKGTKYVGMEHIEQGTGNLLGTISSDDVLSNTFAFNKGDVLYGRLRPYLKKVIVANFDGCCSTEIFPIQSKKIIPPFLMYWFLTDKITNQINATCAGCRMPRGNMNDVLKFDISFPSSFEQQSIVATLDSLKSKVDHLQENYDKISLECDALKQSILRQVFE